MKVSLKLIITAGVLVCAGTLYFLFDPATTLWMPKCPVRWLTGLDCPGCGSQRMIHALLHGDFAGAFRANALLLLMLPYLILLVTVTLFPRLRPRLTRALTSRLSLRIATILIFAWAILRNIRF